MKKKSKGFTLVELLAVIVILAVIALIAVPTILGMIERSRKSSFKSSVLSAYKQVEYALFEKDLSRIPEEGIDVKSLELKHNDLEGLFKQNEKEEDIAYYITNGRYCAYGPLENVLIEKDCNHLDTTEPLVDASKLSFKAEERSIRVFLNDGFATDSESKIASIKLILYQENPTVKSIDGYEQIAEKEFKN